MSWQFHVSEWQWSPDELCVQCRVRGAAWRSVRVASAHDDFHDADTYHDLDDSGADHDLLDDSGTHHDLLDDSGADDDLFDDTDTHHDLLDDSGDDYHAPPAHGLPRRDRRDVHCIR